MSIEAQKAISRRFFEEVVDAGDVDVIGEEGKVSCRLSHITRLRDNWRSRIGHHEVAGKPVSWRTQVIFHFRDGRLAEQWVNRDELRMMIDLGVLEPDYR